MKRTFKDLKETDVIYYVDAKAKKVYEQRLNETNFTLVSNGFNVIKYSDSMGGHGTPDYLNDTMEVAPIEPNATVAHIGMFYYFNYEAAVYELNRKIAEIISVANYHYNKAKKEYEAVLNKYSEI
jgi:hypothetical protein